MNECIGTETEQKTYREKESESPTEAFGLNERRSDYSYSHSVFGANVIAYLSTNLDLSAFIYSLAQRAAHTALAETEK